MPIWTDEQLNQLAVDAEQQINQDLACIYTKFCLGTTSGLSVYTLPSYVRTILRITWRGKKLEPANWEDLQLLSPATAFISPSNPDNVEATAGRPLWYALHPTNIYDIRFYPCPNETFGTSADPFSPGTGASCIVSCYRSIDSTLTDSLAMLPTYIDRRTRKAYVLWKAFEIPGKGQNLEASRYYKAKYDFLIANFIAINEQAHVGQRYSLDEGILQIDNYRMPKPMLPANYERIIY